MTNYFFQEVVCDCFFLCIASSFLHRKYDHKNHNVFQHHVSSSCGICKDFVPKSQCQKLGKSTARGSGSALGDCSQS